MYNLDLFRKKHSKVIDPRHAELPKKKSFDSLAVESKKEGMQLLTRRKIRSVKNSVGLLQTEDPERKIKLLISVYSEVPYNDWTHV